MAGQNLNCQLPKLNKAGLLKPEVGERGNAHLFNLKDHQISDEVPLAFLGKLR
jgi:hypothetical protein